MIYWNLFKEFFIIGLLSFGGGYSTIPFLYHISEKYHWYSIDELTQMLAIASVIPGPVGINMATYAGMKINGITTAFWATVSIIFPALFIVVGVSKLLKKFKDNFFINAAIYGLKPASCALIAAVVVRLIRTSFVNFYDIIIFSILLFFFFTKKNKPIFYLLLSVILGLFLCCVINKAEI